MLFAKILSLSAVAISSVSAAAVALPPRDDGVSISYALAYLNETLNIADYGCAAAPEGSTLKSYTKFVDVLADYTSVIATPWAATDKNACGQCVQVKYTNAAGMTRAVYALTVDSTGGYFNLDKNGFAGLDGYGSFAAGTLVGSALTVPLEMCKRQ